MSHPLAIKLKKARKKARLTQSAAAAAWGVSVRTLQEWEQGRQAPRGIGLQAINEKLDKIIAGSN